jgi:methionyl-tRNA formyltransferase
MKIAFIGGVNYSYDLLSVILKDGWNVSIVFTYDESKKIFYSDIASFDDLTKSNGIKHIKVMNINDPENIKILQKEKPDLILVMGWSQLLKKEIIKIPTLGVIGSHPTELPKYKGRAPIPWTILKDLKQSALTFFYIDEGVDDGDILDQRSFSVTDLDDSSTLYKKMTSFGEKMLLENLPLIENKSAHRKKQDNSKFIEIWPKRTKEDGKINWNETCIEIHKLIRATTHPYPGAFTNFKNKELIIWKSNYLDDSICEPGVIKEIHDEFILVGTGYGSIKILEASHDNKNDLSKIFLDDDIGTQLS